MSEKELAVMNPALRTSDADREQTVRQLQRHVAAGRLSLTILRAGRRRLPSTDHR